MKKIIEETFEKNYVYVGGWNNTLGFDIWRS